MNGCGWLYVVRHVLVPTVARTLLQQQHKLPVSHERDYDIIASETLLNRRITHDRSPTTRA